MTLPVFLKWTAGVPTVKGCGGDVRALGLAYSYTPATISNPAIRRTLTVLQQNNVMPGSDILDINNCN